VADFLFRSTGIANYAFLNSEISQNSLRRKIAVTIYMTFINAIHSFALLMESFVTHAALTMSTDSCFVYVMIDCFKELTLYVFKKADYKFLFVTANDDSVERFQIYFYIISTLMQTR
jgi:Eukaryotic membrane protein family